MAFAMVRVYGMSAKLGWLSFPDEDGAMQFDKPYSDATAQVRFHARALVSVVSRVVVCLWTGVARRWRARRGRDSGRVNPCRAVRARS